MALKPWYKVVNPREDLREGRPLDASEFAVHLDQVRDGRAPEDYQKPERFFDRTYLTASLRSLASEVVRRLSGTKVETSAVFNLATQFGGGKTHALTLLYHLANNGDKAKSWKGVSAVLETAKVPSIPMAQTAVFVGTEFDSLTGRGGKDGTPLRKTPWGEIAFQLGGESAFALLAKHEEQMIAPSSEVIRSFLPKDKPALILLDELINYVSRNRKSGLGAQFYNFLQALSEEARGHDNVVLVASIPASEIEMSSEDQADHERFKKLLDRLGKPVILSAETETSEIIRRRLFEWGGLPDDAKKTVNEYADWVNEHRTQIGDFPVDHAWEIFAATYPFHPSVLSVFERKWQALPRFQQTRGILRLLALWVSRSFQESFKKAHGDPLITLGSAPLDDPTFRAAMFEQLGESKLEAAVTTDIAGKKEAHAIRLDKEAVETIRKARLHQKVATTIFFESNGGQARAEATQPEIRLAAGEPNLDIGNIETVLEALSESCYFLTVEKNRYRFGISANLIKRLADRRSSITDQRIDKRMKDEILNTFKVGAAIERVYFPSASGEIPDRPALSLVVLSTDHAMSEDKTTRLLIEQMIREHGASSRTYKNALIWVVADNAAALRENTRNILAWEDIDDERTELHLDETQQRQLSEHLKRTQRDLKESIWRTYNHVLYLNKKSELHDEPLGLIHSSAAPSLTELILTRLREKDEISEGFSPNQLIKNWPPTFKEWSTRAVRDACYASPLLPRLLNPDAIKQTIARGVEAELLAYVGRAPEGGYKPFHFGKSLSSTEVEISDEMFIITAEEAKKHIEPKKLMRIELSPEIINLRPGEEIRFALSGYDQHGGQMPVSDLQWSATGGKISAAGVYLAPNQEGSYEVTATSRTLKTIARIQVSKIVIPTPIPQPSGNPKRIQWEGEVASQKWMNFYTKFLSRFATSLGLKLTVRVEVAPPDGVPQQKIEEAKVALRELGLSDDVKTTNSD